MPAKSFTRVEIKDEDKGEVTAVVRMCKCGTGTLGPRQRSCDACKQRAHYEAHRRYYEANRDLVLERVVAWRKEHPEQRAEQSRRRYQRDPERHKAIVEAWRQRNPERVRDIREARRARERGAFVEQVDRCVVWEMHRGLCGICGCTVPLGDMHLDHIVPLAKGGRHSYANVQPAHETCNKRKWIHLPEQLEGCVTA